MRVKRSILFGLACLGAACFGAAVEARAALQLRLSSGTQRQVVSIDDTSSDYDNQGDPADMTGLGLPAHQQGLLYWTGSFVGFSVQVEGTSDSPGGLATANLSTLSFTVRNSLGTATKALTIELADTGFTNPGDPTSWMYVTSQVEAVTLSPYTSPTNPAQGTATLAFQSLVGLDDVAYERSVGTASLGTAGSSTAGFHRGASYSLTSAATITLSGGSSVEFDASTRTISTPEPATVVLALTALPVLGIGLWRRRARA